MCTNSHWDFVIFRQTKQKSEREVRLNFCRALQKRTKAEERHTNDKKEKCRRRQTVSDVSHVLTTVHKRPVAFMNKLDAKCSLPLTSTHEHAQHTLTLTHKHSP